MGRSQKQQLQLLPCRSNACRGACYEPIAMKLKATALGQQIQNRMKKCWHHRRRRTKLATAAMAAAALEAAKRRLNRRAAGQHSREKAPSPRPLLPRSSRTPAFALFVIRRGDVGGDIDESGSAAASALSGGGRCSPRPLDGVAKASSSGRNRRLFHCSSSSGSEGDCCDIKKSRSLVRGRCMPPSEDDYDAGGETATTLDSTVISWIGSTGSGAGRLGCGGSDCGSTWDHRSHHTAALTPCLFAWDDDGEDEDRRDDEEFAFASFLGCRGEDPASSYFRKSVHDMAEESALQVAFAEQTAREMREWMDYWAKKTPRPPSPNCTDDEVSGSVGPSAAAPGTGAGGQNAMVDSGGQQSLRSLLQRTSSTDTPINSLDVEYFEEPFTQCQGVEVVHKEENTSALEPDDHASGLIYLEGPCSSKEEDGRKAIIASLFSGDNFPDEATFQWPSSSLSPPLMETPDCSASSDGVCYEGLLETPSVEAAAPLVSPEIKAAVSRARRSGDGEVLEEPPTPTIDNTASAEITSEMDSVLEAFLKTNETIASTSNSAFVAVPSTPLFGSVSTNCQECHWRAMEEKDKVDDICTQAVWMSNAVAAAQTPGADSPGGGKVECDVGAGPERAIVKQLSFSEFPSDASQLGLRDLVAVRVRLRAKRLRDELYVAACQALPLEWFNVWVLCHAYYSLVMSLVAPSPPRPEKAEVAVAAVLLEQHQRERQQRRQRLLVLMLAVACGAGRAGWPPARRGRTVKDRLPLVCHRLQDGDDHDQELLAGPPETVIATAEAGAALDSSDLGDWVI